MQGFTKTDGVRLLLVDNYDPHPSGEGEGHGHGGHTHG